MTAFWDIASCSLEVDRRLLIALMMEAVLTSETLVTFYKNKCCNISEDCHLYVYVDLRLSDLEVIRNVGTYSGVTLTL
jgi:hypothetical protein